MMLEVPGQLYNLAYTAFSGALKIFYSQFNTSAQNSVTFSLDNIQNSEGYLEIYHIGPDYNSTVPVINLSYSGEKCEDALSIYKCAQWDYAQRKCLGQWILSSGTQDKANKTFSLNPGTINAIRSLSGFHAMDDVAGYQ